MELKDDFNRIVETFQIRNGEVSECPKCRGKRCITKHCPVAVDRSDMEVGILCLECGEKTEGVVAEPINEEQKELRKIRKKAREAECGGMEESFDDYMKRVVEDEMEKKRREYEVVYR